MRAAPRLDATPSGLTSEGCKCALASIYPKNTPAEAIAVGQFQYIRESEVNLFPQTAKQRPESCIQELRFALQALNRLRLGRRRFSFGIEKICWVLCWKG